MEPQPMEMAEIRCSIVILNWNGTAMLRRYLPSVVAHCPKDAEIVVADNGSTDDSLSVLADDFPSVRVIALDQNYGFAEGYNLAIQQITAPYCVLLNSDVEVTKGWLSPLLDYMQQHRDVAAVQPKIRSDRRRTHFEHAGAAGGYLDVLGYPYCRGRVLSKVEEDHGQYDTPADIFWATGACLVCRTSVYQQVGGLDADFFAHMEEIDFCWRLGARGYRLVCLPESVVYHLGGGSLPYDNPRKTFLNFRNNLLMLYKNLPTKRLLWLMPLRMGLDYVAALQFVLKGQWRNCRSVFEARIAYHRMKSTMREKRKENMRLAHSPLPSTIRGCIFLM